MTAEQMEALLAEHYPVDLENGYFDRCYCGWELPKGEDFQKLGQQCWTPHMAEVLTDALPPVEWGVEYTKYGNGVVAEYGSEAYARAHAEDMPEYRRVVKRTVTPWQPVD